MRFRTAAILVTLFVLAASTPVLAARSDAKAIWGPVTVDGRSQFPLYHNLGVGIFQMDLDWFEVAAQAPADPTNPNDPAYHWPADISYAIQHALRYHMRILLQVLGTPGWANGGQAWNFPPTDPSTYADFLIAAARRYPSVHLWMIWGEPNRVPLFGIDVPADPSSTTLTAAQAQGPQVYAQMLDASYGALKAVSARNLVIGGNTFTTGDISTEQWIENLRLPNGQPPRMDMYGHNPFTWRAAPDLSNPPSPDGEYDFSDLGRLEQLVNNNLARSGQQLKLYLSEWTIPTSPNDDEFSTYVSPSVQAQWITDAWQIVRSSTWIYALGWIHVYDEAPGGSSGGLLNYDGTPKPGYFAFQAG